MYLIIKGIILSTCTTFISLALVLLLPVNVAENKIGPSPYQEQINELLSKTSKGLHPTAPEWGQLKTLVAKSNSWFSQKREVKGFINIANLKSTSNSPILFIVWAMFFYYFYRKGVSWKSLAFLVTPTVFSFMGGFSFFTLLLIFCGVSLSFLIVKFKAFK